MQKRIFKIIIVLVFFLGLIVLLYPTISNWYNEQMSSYVVSNYTDVVDNGDKEKYAQIMEDAREYNKNLHSKPKHFITGAPEDPEYINALDVYNGMMGYIKIDKIGIKTPISHGTHEDVLQNEIGHLEGSSLPTGDVGNNTVITGHTGLPSAELFTNLDKMEIGDIFEICVLNNVFTYEVFNIVVVLPHEVDNLEPVEGEDVVTLITCTPYGINSHRLLVQGKQIEVPEKEIIIETDTNIDEFDFMKFLPLVLVFVIIILLILIIISRKKDKKYRYRR